MERSYRSYIPFVLCNTLDLVGKSKRNSPPLVVPCAASASAEQTLGSKQEQREISTA